MSVAEDRSLELALPHAQSTATRWARQHSLAEALEDRPVEATMATISGWDVSFVMHNPLAERQPEFVLLTDRDQVEQFYTGTLGATKILTQDWVAEVNGPWFQLAEVLSDVRDVASGAEQSIQMAVVFVSWTDGIVSELAWFTEKEWAERPFLAEQQLQLSRLLGAFDEAWRSGDVDGRLAAVEDQTFSVIRISDAQDGDRRDRRIARTPDELRAAWSSPEAGRVLELERTSHVITSWYVFASYKLLVELDDRTVVRETVCLFPVSRNFKFACELSYSIETELKS